MCKSIAPAVCHVALRVTSCLCQIDVRNAACHELNTKEILLLTIPPPPPPLVVLLSPTRGTYEVVEEAYSQEKKLQRQPRGLDKLSTATREAFNSLQPGPWDRQVREELVREVNQFAAYVFPGSSVVPFGSYRMDMYSWDGDLDLSLDVPSSYLRQGLQVIANDPSYGLEISREDKLTVLRKLARYLRNYESSSKSVRAVNLVSRAVIPVLKFVDSKSGVECDISVGNRDGVFKSALIGMIGTIDIRFKQLTFLVKAWARKNKINDAKNGSLNSLAWILLVAFHLQTRDPPILPPFSCILHGSKAADEGDGPQGLVCTPDDQTLAKCQRRIQQYISSGYGQDNTELLAELLASFFTKLSAASNLWHKGLCASTYHGRWIIKTSFPKENNETFMAVEDFLDRDTNCARACRKREFDEITAVVKATLHMAVNERPLKHESLMEYIFGPVGRRRPGQPLPRHPTYRHPDMRVQPQYTPPFLQQQQPWQQQQQQLGWVGQPPPMDGGMGGFGPATGYMPVHSPRMGPYPGANQMGMPGNAGFEPKRKWDGSSGYGKWKRRRASF
ncbi:hypothetical protein CBR_g6688 [Chara braunii]|uniref:Poly(A) RNA polymerase mitochondrial-like central palm domain-containing protein n=1 Tax=Chara braunii TaxID=69332 RepID=A0A388KKI1_CHABU|nr:hypothetical protein CBR_g6688 [Chara braunii]|eukprot:GBG70562.1 hypothetical protein CBR_g6688 [Chara braunii]